MFPLNIIDKNKKIIYLVLTSLVLIALGGFFYYRISERHRHEFKVAFLNVGQGDSTLIQFSDGEKMLVDCGPNKGILSALGRNMAFYDRTIDYVLATHPDLDHYGGCVDVIRQYHVKHIITNGRDKPYDGYWREWNAAMRASGAELITMASPTVWTIANDTLQFLSPDPSCKLNVKADDNNNYSIVFKLTHFDETPSAGSPLLRGRGQGNFLTFLFTGDMEVPLEHALMEKYCSFASSTVEAENFLPLHSGSSSADCSALQADILKVGHHGSDTATSEEFLAFVRPEKAIISVGPNKYGHPTLRAIRHLERVGAQILRTDEVGDIVEK